MSSFTEFDVGVLAILFIFITMCFFKGGIKSILGLVKWYGAGIITLWLYPHAREYVQDMFPDSKAVNIIAIIGTYIACLIALVIINMILVAAMGGIVGGFGDRFIGAVVGFSIGYIFASTIHFTVSSVYQGNDPDWLKKGSTYNVTGFGSNILKKFFNDDMGSIVEDLGLAKEKLADAMEKKQEKNLSPDSTAAEILGSIDQNMLKSYISQLKDEGYKQDEIKALMADPEAASQIKSLIEQSAIGIGGAAQINDEK